MMSCCAELKSGCCLDAYVMSCTVYAENILTDGHSVVFEILFGAPVEIVEDQLTVLQSW